MMFLRGHLAETTAPRTANRTLSAIKQVLRAAWRLGQMTAEQLHTLLDVPQIKGHRLAKGRALTLDEVEALVMEAQRNGGVWRGTRNACMFGVLYTAGLRRSELATLCCDHVTQDDGGRYTLRVLGKGNKERAVPLPLAMGELMSRWLKVRGDEPGALFPSTRPTEENEVGKAMSSENVRLLMVRIVRKLNMQHASPHDLRRTFISELLDRTTDPSTVQQLAGHANLATTLQYDRRGARAKIRAVEALVVPFVRS